MSRSGRLSFVMFAILASAWGCAAGPADGSDEVEGTSVALSTVPATGVTCISVKAFNAPGGMPTGSALTTVNSAPTPGAAMWSINLSLGTYTKGTVQITANAYAVACASIGSANPTWVADPVVLMVSPGLASSAALQFRESLPIATSGNFVPSVTDVSIGDDSMALRLADGTVRMRGLVANPTGLTNVVEVATGRDHACARKKDGTVWCWGANNNGQLGNGSTTASPTTPVQVPGIAGATALALSSLTSCASSATLTYCWGATGFGSPAFNTTPVQVLSQPAIAIGTGPYHTCVADNELGGTFIYCLGTNSNGQLGNGSTTGSATAVGGLGLTALVDVAAGWYNTCAADALGRAWCWGAGNNGRLGNGTTTTSSVPVRVSAVPSTVTQIAYGQAHGCVRTSNSDVWCWGFNVEGQVGDGSGVDQLTPVKVLSGSALKVFAGMNSTCALLTDGTLSCWGASHLLGNPTNTPRFKPAPFNP